MKYCTKCGTPNNDDSAFCLKCGSAFQDVQDVTQVQEIQQVQQAPQEQPQNQYVYTGPQQPIKPKKKGKGCLIVFIVLVAIFIIPIIIAITGIDYSAPSQSKVGITMELNDEQTTDVLSIFEQCGIGDIASVELFQTGEDRTSYYVDDIETAAYSGANNTIVVWMDNTTKTVLEIYFNDVTIYADGKVKAQLPDYYISEKLRDTYRVNAQMYINQCLTYPDTAKYPSISGWSFGVRDGLDVVQSSVTMQNAFGVSNTVKFQIKFDRSTGKVVSLILDGKEYIN